jgi:heterodisulfide reductase subunit A
MRIGVYICHCGGNISEVVDIQSVTSFAEGGDEVVLVRDHEHICSEPGQKLISDDIREHNLDRIVVGACSPKFHEETFRTTITNAGLNPYVLEMANLREQCSWPHYHEPGLATEKAKALVGMALAKVRLDEPLAKKSMPIGKRVLVVGAGISGIQAALDLGDAGFTVYLVEQAPSIGGKMARLLRTFPTEDCAACILSPKMAAVPANPNIKLLTNTDVESVSGYLGNFEVTVVKKPRYVNMEECLTCGICEEKCPVKVPNEYEEGLTTRKAIYIPFSLAVPYKNLIDEKACLRLKKGGKVCGLCEKHCPHGAIEFDQKPETETFTVDTIIVATGYDVFDAAKKEVYGFNGSANVVTGMQMERLLAHEMEGEPLREIGKRVAFVQCVGSRDEQIGREYCSRVCCMYATKLSQLLKRSDPQKDVYVFYTDLRAYGKGFEEYYKRAQQTGVKFIRGRVAEVMENPQTKKATLRAEDTLSRQIIESDFDLVVLSVGMEPSEGTKKIAEILRLARGPDGFIQEAHPKFRPVDTLAEGIFICGCAQGPKDIPDSVAQASAASSRAIRLMNRGEYDLDPVVSCVDDAACDGCAYCIEPCPYDALTLIEYMRDGAIKKTVQSNEILCHGCGTCMATCPKRGIYVHHFKLDMISAMVDAALQPA